VRSWCISTLSNQAREIATIAATVTMVTAVAAETTVAMVARED